MRFGFLIAAAVVVCGLVSLNARAATAVCSVEPVGQRRLAMFLDHSAHVTADDYCAFIHDYLAPNGFDTLLLTIDAYYAYTSHPDVVRTPALTKADVQKIVAACREHGIEFIPEIELLGHQSTDRSWGILKAYPKLDESLSKETVSENYHRSLCPNHPDALGIACALMDELVEACGAKAVHIGCDEVFEIGVCDRCKDTDHGKLFADWVNALNRHNREKGVETMIWGDRLIKRSGTPYNAYDSSENGTETALEKLDKDIVICDWHYYESTFPSVDLFTEAGFKTWICPWNNLGSAKKFIAYADAHEANGNVVGVMLTEWNSLDKFVAALKGSTADKDCTDCAAVFNYLKRPVAPPDPPAGTAYWRRTSNATADAPTWTTNFVATISNDDFDFTGEKTEDNVIELLENCEVKGILVFEEPCTIRTTPGLGVKKMTFTKDDYCVSKADVVTSNVTFTGGAQWTYPEQPWNFSASNSATAGNCAWAIIGTASLTLGSGTTICDFVPSATTGIDSYGGAIILPYKTSDEETYNSSRPELTISEGAKILNVRGGAQPAVTVADKMHNAVVNMTGGEISGCYSAKNSSSKYGVILVMNGTFNLSGGRIHGNYVYKNAGYSGINVNGGTLNLSGTPIVRDNFANTSPATLSNLRVSGTGSIHLAGDLEEGASVGCSQNIGENNEFGTADGEYAGAQRIHADGSELVGKRDSAKLVWATASEPRPTVGGQEVEPDKVFDLAREAKPITYPSAPEVSWAEGSQRIDFGSVSVEVPRHYTASLEGNVVSIALNRNAAPTIADSDGGEKKGIALKDGQVKIHFEPQAEGLFYTLETATEPQGEWTAVVGPQAETDFAVPVDGEKRFYRIKVTD